MSAKQIRELGLFITADDFEGGRITEKQARGRVTGSLQARRDFLATHTYKPGTCGEETHERVSAWCDRAEAVLAQSAPAEEIGDLLAEQANALALEDAELAEADMAADFETLDPAAEEKR